MCIVRCLLSLLLLFCPFRLLLLFLIFTFYFSFKQNLFAQNHFLVHSSNNSGTTKCSRLSNVSAVVVISGYGCPANSTLYRQALSFKRKKKALINQKTGVYRDPEKPIILLWDGAGYFLSHTHHPSILGRQCSFAHAYFYSLGVEIYSFSFFVAVAIDFLIVFILVVDLLCLSLMLFE